MPNKQPLYHFLSIDDYRFYLLKTVRAKCSIDNPFQSLCNVCRSFQHPLLGVCRPTTVITHCGLSNLEKRCSSDRYYFSDKSSDKSTLHCFSWKQWSAIDSKHFSKIKVTNFIIKPTSHYIRKSVKGQIKGWLPFRKHLFFYCSLTHWHLLL